MATVGHQRSTVDFTDRQYRLSSKTLLRFNTGLDFRALVACTTERFDLKMIFVVSDTRETHFVLRRKQRRSISKSSKPSSCSWTAWSQSLLKDYKRTHLSYDSIPDQ